MEQFDIPHQRVKEKNVYQLNLDAPRIILISAAIIGIVLVSFLLGMNFIKGGDGAKTFMTTGDIFDSQKELDLLKTNIPAAPDEEELSKPLDEKLAATDGELNGAGLKSDPDFLGGEKQIHDDLPLITGNESSSSLTRDNVMEPVTKKPAAKRSTLTASDAKRISRSADPEPSARHIRKATVKGDTKKKKSVRSKVVAVSEDRDDYTRTTGAAGYTVQVASLDTKQRALAEVRSLREKRYDAYLDFTQMNGKKFYRVRVGPFASKTKALDLLREFQEKERYRESYMVRE